MRQGGTNTFFRFVLGFTTFIAVSLGLTYVVSVYSIEQEKKQQTAAAFQTMTGGDAEGKWWVFWK
jgi:hypothetical protein